MHFDTTVHVADRKPVPTHLPLAWTRSSTEDIESFMTQLETLAKSILSQPDEEIKASLNSTTPQLG